MKPRILMFAGSLRRDSHQLRLIRYMAERIAPFAQIDILLPSEVDLPLFNQDLENEPEIRAKVWAIYERFAAAQAMIIASPEYNAQVSPFLKNTFDWVSRLPRIQPPTPSAFKYKPLLLSCATTGRSGGIQGLAAARLLFAYMGFTVIPGQVSVSEAEYWRVDDQFVFEEGFASYIDQVLQDFISITRRSVTPITEEIHCESTHS